MPDSLMEAIEFHTGVEDATGFAVRMLRKAYRQGQRVLVTAPMPVLEHINSQLWQLYEREFIAHVLVARCRTAQAARTPLWLATAATAALHEPVVVINVGTAAPADPGRLERLIEVVAADAEGAAQGRQRWRQYRAAGFQITHIQASAST